MRKLVGGFGLLSLSLFMLLGYSRADITGGPAVEVLTFLFAVVLPAAGGAGLLYSHHRQSQAVERRRHRRRLEGVKSDLVGLARRRGGKLTVVEAMSELRLEAQLAEEALRGLRGGPCTGLSPRGRAWRRGISRRLNLRALLGEWRQNSIGSGVLSQPVAGKKRNAVLAPRRSRGILSSRLSKVVARHHLGHSRAARAYCHVVARLVELRFARRP